MIVPEGANTFINSVLNNQTTIQFDSDIYRDVVGILERKERLTENNIIVGSSIIYNINSQESILDEDFYQFRWKIETVGNLFNEILRKNRLELINMLCKTFQNFINFQLLKPNKE